MTDVCISDQGTIVSFTLNTESAKKFVAEQVEVESYLRFSNGFHADSRMAQSIIEGMIDEGLSVS